MGGSGDSGYTFTADQTEAAIEKALREGNVEELPGLLRLLLSQDPIRAVLIFDTLKTALAIRNEIE